MKKNTLLHTNLLVCAIITVGFIITSIIGYRSNTHIFKQDVERVSALTSEGIYYKIDKILSEPVNVSLTMANDSLLKNFLDKEELNLDNEAYVQELRDYLYAYREKYDYDSVFLVSTLTNRYYHFEGLDRVLTLGEPENTWYYDFLDNPEEYSLNVDNDEAADNSITVFVNCKITDQKGDTVGVIGVGLKVASLQELFKEYDNEYGVSVCLIDTDGYVQVSSAQTGYQHISLFEDEKWSKLQDNILEKKETPQTFWYHQANSRGYAITRYVPNLKWYLVVQNDMTLMDRQFSLQFSRGIAIIGFIIAFVLLIITRVLKKYKAQILMLSTSQKEEYNRLLFQVTEGLYENILEFDITHNTASGEGTKNYLKTLDLEADATFDQALLALSCHIKEEYAKEYLEMFSRTQILYAYNQGITNLSYDIPYTADGIIYHWMRISARIFYWTSDESVRVITYLTNIDAEKERERNLLETTRRDSMTGLYNKGAAEKLVADILERDQNTDRTHAYLIFDIDDFKNINDKYGHTFGDTVIKEFALEIQTLFRDDDIIGRIGGDEFAVLMIDCKDTALLCERLERCCQKISTKNFGQEAGHSFSISIGAALFPDQGTTYGELFGKADEALYFAKAHGKNTFHMIGITKQADAGFRLDSRDIRSVLENTSDGVAKYAYAASLKLLYFDKKLGALVGSVREMVSTEDFDPYSFVLEEDLPILKASLLEALPNRKNIDVNFHLRRYDGTYCLVRLRGFFVSELYQNCYPVFYAVYTDLSSSPTKDGEQQLDG